MNEINQLEICEQMSNVTPKEKRQNKIGAHLNRISFHVYRLLSVFDTLLHSYFVNRNLHTQSCPQKVN